MSVTGSSMLFALFFGVASAQFGADDHPPAGAPANNPPAQQQGGQQQGGQQNQPPAGNPQQVPPAGNPQLPQQRLPAGSPQQIPPAGNAKLPLQRPAGNLPPAPPELPSAQPPTPDAPKLSVVLSVDAATMNAMLDMVSGKIPKKSFRPILTASGVTINARIDGDKLAIGIASGSLIRDAAKVGVERGGVLSKLRYALSPSIAPEYGFNTFSFPVKENMRNAAVTLNFDVQTFSPIAAPPTAGGNESFLSEIVKSNPEVGEPLAKVMAGEMGGLLPAIFGGLQSGAAFSANSLAEHMNHVLQVLTMAPSQAAAISVIKGIETSVDLLNTMQFEGILPSQPVTQSSLRQPMLIARGTEGPVVAPQSAPGIPGIATAFAETPPSAGESESLDPFLDELANMADQLFAPITIQGVPIAIPSGQPSKAIAYLKEVERKTIDMMRLSVTPPDLGSLTDQQTFLNIKISELIYDIKTSLLSCVYSPNDVNKRIKRLLVDDFLKPPLRDAIQKEERELDIYNADTSEGDRKNWTDAEQDASRENRTSGSKRSETMVKSQVAQDRIVREQSQREESSYENDEAGGAIYRHKKGRMYEHAGLSGREIGDLIGGNADVSLAAYAKVITKYIVEDALDDWADSSDMNFSSVYDNVASKITKKFLETKLADDAEKRKIIADAADKTMTQLFAYTLKDALAMGDAALKSYSNILDALNAFQKTYCKHKDEIDNVLKAADNVIAEARACDFNESETPEDPVVIAAKKAAAEELKKMKACQSTAATFINLTTIAKNSLLQILRQQIKHIYGTYGFRAPTEAEINSLTTSNPYGASPLKDLYDKFYENDEGVRGTGQDGSRSPDELIKDISARTKSAIRGVIQVGLRAHMLRGVRDKWLVGLDGALKIAAAQQSGDQCAATSAYKKYDPTLSAIFKAGKDDTRDSVYRAILPAKALLGDIGAQMDKDLYGSSEDPGLFALEQQLKVADELVRQILGFVSNNQGDVDAAVKEYDKLSQAVKAITDSAKEVGLKQDQMDAANAKAQQENDRKLLADSREGGRKGALARQKFIDEQADGEKGAAKQEGVRTANGIAQEMIRKAVEDVADEAKNDLDRLKSSQCGCGDQALWDLQTRYSVINNYRFSGRDGCFVYGACFQSDSNVSRDVYEVDASGNSVITGSIRVPYGGPNTYFVNFVRNANTGNFIDMCGPMGGDPYVDACRNWSPRTDSATYCAQNSSAWSDEKTVQELNNLFNQNK